MIDLAELQLVVDARQVIAATKALDDLTKAGARAEASIQNHASATAKAEENTRKQTAATKDAEVSTDRVSKIMLRSAEMTEKFNRANFEAIRKRDEGRSRSADTALYRQMFDEIQAKDDLSKKNEQLARTESALAAARARTAQTALGASMARDLAAQNNALAEATKRASAATGTFSGNLRQTSHEMRSLALDISGAGLLITGFMALLTAPAAIGVKLQSDLENTRLGMAAILVSMTRINGEATTLPKAMEVSGEIVKQLVADSLKYGVNVATLADTMRAVMAPGLGAGMSLRQIQEIATFGTIAVKTIGLDAKQTVQEIRDLVAGGISAASSTLATSLQIKDSDIARWREAGTLYAELFNRMRGFAATAEESTKTLTGAWQVLQTKMALLFTDEEGFTGVKDTLVSISEYIGDVNAQTGKMEFNPDVLAATQAYWEMLKGVLSALNSIGSVLAYRVELNPFEDKNLLLDVATWVDSLGAAIADAIKKGVRRAVYGQTDELAAPRGLGLGDGPAASYNFKPKPEEELVGPLPSLADAEKRWKQAIGSTVLGLTMEYEEQLKAFRRDRELLDKHKALKGADQAELARKEAVFRQARLDAERTYLNALERLRGPKSEADKLSLESQKIYWQGIRVTEAETAALDKKTRAIERQVLRLEESKSQATLSSATDNMAAALAIEAVPLANPAELDKARSLRDLSGAQVNLAGVEQQNEQLDLLITRAREASEVWADAAKNIRSSLGEAFGAGGQALSGFFAAYAEGEANLQSIQQERHQRIKDDPARQSEYELQALKETELATVSTYASMAGSAKGFFKQGTTGYELLGKAEQAFRLLQFAMSVKSLVMAATETSTQVALSGVKTAAYTTEGVAKGFSQLGVFGFVAAAAIVAYVASMGGNVRAGSATAPETRKLGTGSVLGDSSAVSDSVRNSLDILAKNSQPMLGYTRQMAEILNVVQFNLAGVGRTAAKPPRVGGSFNANPEIGEYGGGLTFDAQTVAQAAAGVRGSIYQSIWMAEEERQVPNPLAGVDGASDTLTEVTPSGLVDVLAPLDQDLTTWLTDTVGSLRTAVLTGANILGIEGAEKVIDNMSLGLSRLNFEGLSGEEIEKAIVGELNTVFDNMALAVIPELEKFQRVGEGLGETLSRLVTEYLVVDRSLAQLGITFTTVGVESLGARERLIELAGGLDDFQKKTDFFAKNFLTSGQVLTLLERQLTTDLASLGYTGIRTKEQFVALVQSLDVSTESGAKAFTSLMNVSDSFLQVANAAEALSKKRMDLEIRLLELSGRSSEALAMKRERELAALDESLRPLQELIYAQEDLNAVYDKASASLSKLKLLTTDSFATLFDYSVYLRKAAQAGVSGAEAALPPDASNTFIPGRTNTSSTAELVAAIDKLRAEQQAGQIAMAQYLRQTSEILRRWNGDGMPAVRSVA